MSEQEEFEFRARMEAEQSAPAKPTVMAKKDLPKRYEPTMGEKVSQGALNFLSGATRGAGSIGATLLSPFDAAARALNGGKPVSIGDFEVLGQDRRSAMDQTLQNEFGAETDSLGYKGGKIAAEIAGTAGAGGTAAKVIGRAAPALAATQTGGKLLSAITSGGFRTGAPAAATFTGKAADMGIRALGGGINGGLSAGMIDPASAKIGAGIGAALPPGLKALGKAGGYIGNTAKGLIQPLTKRGQQEIAGNVLREFGQGGPMAINTAEIIPGSVPTLAEATGNAGLAGLQRTARDLRPNAFVEREAGNAAARSSLFDSIAGDATALEAARAARSSEAGSLYNEALNRAPNQLTDEVAGEVASLLTRPSIESAKGTATRWAAERGEAQGAEGSMRAMHDMKMALDDQIGEAVRAGKGGEAAALQATKEKLMSVLDNMSDTYRAAGSKYREMSQPINAMETLQGLKLTDQYGNITLAKVQNALGNLGKAQAAPGVNGAKSITGDQIRSLKQIRDDLMRQSNTSLGRSAGSNTFQNLATDNLLAKVLPGRLGGAVNNRIGDAVGQAGKLLYSGANEKIKNNLVDMMLDPAMAQRALSLGPTPMNPRLAALLEQMGQVGYRTAPQLAPNR